MDVGLGTESEVKTPLARRYGIRDHVGPIPHPDVLFKRVVSRQESQSSSTETGKDKVAGVFSDGKSESKG